MADQVQSTVRSATGPGPDGRAAGAGRSGEQPGSDSAALPLSYEQEWFFYRGLLYPDEAFPLWVAYDIKGPLDTAAFRQALDDLIARHPAMRAVFSLTTEGRPGQALLEVAAAQRLITFQHVASGSWEKFDAYARALAKSDAVTSWRLDREPAYRIRLLQYSSTEHVLLATLHHIAFDLSALQIFERELWTFTAAHAAGRELLILPSGDLAEILNGHRRRYDHRATTVNSAYWRKYNSLAPPIWQRSATLDTPAPCPAERAVTSSEYDGKLLEGLRAACRELGCSVFELCLSLFAWLAFELSYQERLALHVIFDSRNTGEKDLIGMFSGVLPVILRRPEGSAASFLGQVRREVLRVLMHRHVGGDEVIAGTMRQWSRWRAQPVRALSLNYIRIGAGDPRRSMPAGLQITRRSRRDYAPVVGAAPNSLAFIVREHDEMLETFAEYNPHSLSGELVRAVMSAFGQMLRATAEARQVVVAAAVEVAGRGDGRERPSGAPAEPPGAITPLLDADGLACLHVDCTEVRDALLRHPAVRSADVRVEPHADGGSEVVAYVRADGGLSADEARDFCANWPARSAFLIPPGRVCLLADAEVPREAAGAGPPGPPGNRGPAARRRDADALLTLILEALPGAAPDSEFWSAGGSFATISQIARGAQAAGLPQPLPSDFGSPRTLESAVDAILARTGRTAAGQ